MFTDLLLALTIVTGTTAIPAQASVNADRMIASPSAIAGPVRTRHRKPGGISQVASAAVRQQNLYHHADDSARPE